MGNYKDAVCCLIMAGESVSAMTPCVELTRSWWQWHPPVGMCVALVGVMGVPAPWLRNNTMSRTEKRLWIIGMIGLTFLELWSIHQDGRERDAEQAFVRSKTTEL
jgi:hypothetical protein